MKGESERECVCVYISREWMESEREPHMNLGEDGKSMGEWIGCWSLGGMETASFILEGAIPFEVTCQVQSHPFLRFLYL